MGPMKTNLRQSTKSEAIVRYIEATSSVYVHVTAQTASTTPSLEHQVTAELDVPGVARDQRHIDSEE